MAITSNRCGVVGFLASALLALATVGAALATPSSAAVANAAPDAGARRAINGTVTWQTVTQIDQTFSDDSGPTERHTSTTTDAGTLNVTLRRNPKYARVFVVDGAGSRYDYAFSSDSTIASGGCIASTTARATASGTFPRFTTTIHPSLAAIVVPGVNPPSIGSKTKALVLLPGISYVGTSTTTDTGASPCLNGTEVKAIGGDAEPSAAADRVCYPRGVSPASVSPNAGQLVGAWRQSMRRFVFDCSKSWTTDSGDIVTTTVTGFVRYG